MDEVYGKSEAVSVLVDIKAVNDAPTDVRVAASARFVEERLFGVGTPSGIILVK